MQKESKEKLEDYLSGFAEVKKVSSFPIGTVIVNEKDRRSALTAFKHFEVAVLDLDGKKPTREVLSEALSIIAQGKGVGINFKSAQADVDFRDFLADLALGRVDTRLTGQAEPLERENILNGSYLIVLMNGEQYAAENFSDSVLTFCNLT